MAKNNDVKKAKQNRQNQNMQDAQNCAQDAQNCAQDQCLNDCQNNGNKKAKRPNQQF